MVVRVSSKEQIIFFRLSNIIGFVEGTYQISASGVRGQLERIVKPEGKKPKFKGAIPEIYQDILDFYNSVPNDITQSGALIILNSIKEKYSSLYRL